MLSLYTSGCKYSRRRCEGIIHFFVKKYLKRHKIELEVLHRGLLREGVYGWCTVIDCNWKPRSFLIEIHNQLSVEDYTKTLLHELYHILQHIRGDLRDKRGIRCWKGIDCSELDYSEQKWEIEAKEAEEKLYQEYIKTTKY